MKYQIVFWIDIHINLSCSYRQTSLKVLVWIDFYTQYFIILENIGSQ